ncbi:MAG: corrinoid protein [Planctomycetes bacterium]|nr:corrinoid protein [Planctomycetota bacterium]
MPVLDEMSQLLQQGKAKEVAEKVEAALAENLSPKQILDEGLLAGMAIIGGKFKNNEVYVPEVLIAARAMNAGMKILEPQLASAGVDPIGTIVVGTVKGDLHDIGKNLVCMMFKGGGFKVIDAGIDVPAEKFLELVKEHDADILGCSALLTTTMPAIKEVVDAVKASGAEVKIIIGGAPVTQAYCDEIGADGYAPDAASAVDVGKSLL